MIRSSLLWMFISLLAVYAWKDWYKSLCGLIILTAFIEHPDMPRTIMNIPGLNPWNLLFIIILISWYLSRVKEGLKWDMPQGFTLLLVLQFILFTIGFLRILFDASGLEEIKMLKSFGSHISTIGLWNSYFINTLKWVIPGLLLFHGCNSRSRLLLAIFSILAMYLVLSLLIYKAIPPWKIIDVDSLTKHSLKLDQRVGYHRVDLSAMLAGASWAIFAVIVLAREGWQRIWLLVAGGMVILGQALTGGRSGYMAWFVIGLFFGLFRWRRIMIILPLILVILLFFIPQIKDRILIGFDTQETGSSIYTNTIDVKTLTAGRNGIWRLTLEEFWEAPLFGHGRQAIFRTGIHQRGIEELGEAFGHPHSAYLEQLLDNGIAGLVIILLFYLSAVRKSFSLLRDKTKPYHAAIGSVAFALISAQLITSLTAQSFYPRQGVVGMWCAIGLMLRVYVERDNVSKGVKKTFFWEQIA